MAIYLAPFFLLLCFDRVPALFKRLVNSGQVDFSWFALFTPKFTGVDTPQIAYTPSHLKRLAMTCNQTIQLRVTLQWLTFCAILSPFTANRSVRAELPVGSFSLVVSRAVIGQSPSGDVKKANDILHNARNAIERGDFEQATSLIDQAEALDVQRDSSFSAHPNSPQKLRQELNELRKNVLVNPPRKSKRLLPSLFGRRNDPGSTEIPQDPFQIQPNEEEQLANLLDNSKIRAQEYLANGQLALSQRNYNGAVTWYRKAAALNAQFGPEEYSPEQLLEDLRLTGIVEVNGSDGYSQPVGIVSDSTPQVNPFTQPGNLPTGQLALNSDLNSTSSELFTQGASGLVNPFVDNTQVTPPTGTSNVDTGFQAFPTQPGVASLTEPPLPQTPKSTLEPNFAAPPDHLEGPQSTAHSRSPADGNTIVGSVNSTYSGSRPERTFSNRAATGAQNNPDVSPVKAPRRGGLLASAAAQLADGPQSETGEQPENGVAAAIYKPESNNSRNRLANTLPGRGTPVTSPFLGSQKLTRAGNSGTSNADTTRGHFSKALEDNSKLNSNGQQQLQDQTKLFNTQQNVVRPPRNQTSAVDTVEAQQALLWRQWISEVTYLQREAEKLEQTDPFEALKTLNELKQRIKASALSEKSRSRLVVRVDATLRRLETFIDQNRADLELDQENQAVLDDIRRGRALEQETQEKLAELVDQFNGLLDQRRYAEARLIARQARELAPDNELTTILVWKSDFIQRNARNVSFTELQNDGFLGTMESTTESSLGFDDRDPLKFPNQRDWEDLSRRRLKRVGDPQSHLSESEREIYRQLKTPVEVHFNNRPLKDVMDTLSNLTSVNIFLDPLGMMAEGVTSDEPVTLNLSGKPISLKSALTLILEPLRLSYVIRNEVLKITSEQMKDSEVYPHVYNVADLVTPIPNFVPSHNLGMPAAMAAAHDALGYGKIGGKSYSGPLILASQEEGQQGATTSPSVLSQMLGGGVPMAGQSRGSRQPIIPGPGGLGGAAAADFDSLIELITTTIKPDTWEEVGGSGAIQEFEGTLSLVVTQTQDVHEEVADLLEQLRRLQDLQVTIEVRYIVLSDNFFEKMGVDFNFDIDDNTGLGYDDMTIRNDDDGGGGGEGNQPARGWINESPSRPDNGPSFTTGLNALGPTADLDLQFRQGSFAASAPIFGGFDPESAANFGFAILSDIEAFFLIQATQGDSRSNIMQSPKVTLFNGQQASISDQSQRPFVTSVIPVVGDFAAAQQPVITVLSEGTSLSVQAVVSPDRRFVRLTLVPFFSKIGHVQTFTFTGSSSSSSGTAAVDPSDETNNVQNEIETFSSGTTVQLPEFKFVTVNTTVSVPDGGTILLGGIKRLSEGRVERGVPMLSKLPYVNRLFTNVGIGREAESLMLMVTPRIIIKEEEEEILIGGNPP